MNLIFKKSTFAFLSFLMVGLLFSVLANGQPASPINVSGSVMDSKGEPIIGANILLKGTASGTVTDFDGNFVVEVAGNGVLTISYIGYLPQEASIFRKLSVADNILAILELRKDLDRSGRIQALDNLLREFHITHLRDNKGMSLSGGERRRVEIARALATDPKFILLDEPFAGVDPISVGDIKQIINHLKDKGIGVLITDHNVRETLDICETAYIVSAGKIIAEGSPSSVLENQLVKDVYLGQEFHL